MRPEPTKRWRSGLAALLAAQLIIFEYTIARRPDFASTALPRWIIAAVVSLVYLLAINFLTLQTGWSRHFRWAVIGTAVILSLRFYSPVFFGVWSPDQTPKEVMAANIAPRFGAFLREMAAAQEQYRLREHFYSASMAPLRAWVREPSGAAVEIIARGDTGWSAVVSRSDRTCTIWVRDLRLRQRQSDVEGSPVCGDTEIRGRHQTIQTVLSSHPRERRFNPSDAGGVWLQHRADALRSGIARAGSTGAGHNWTAMVGGPIRASAAVVGNQVFVGSHANGEIVALSLDSGIVGFRIRAPNWVHHEPVVTNALAIFGFGNNEPSDVNASFVGSPPSGIVAYNRLSGREHWRRYTGGSVMGSPVIWNGIVAVATGDHEAVAWRISDGAQLWRAPLPDYSPMANPLLIDSLFIVGVEPATVCAIAMSSGRRIYCSILAPGSWGAGHASTAIAGELVLQVYEEDLDGSGGKADGPVMRRIRRIVGAPPRRHHPRPPNALREQVLVALRWRDGKEAWRVRLGEGRTASAGHIAGTPAVVGGIAFVPSPINQTISAIDTRKGRLIWSSRVNPARGSVLVLENAVIAATRDSGLVVLDAGTGALRCRQRLPQSADRAGPAVSGATGVLTLTGGMVMARPLGAWLTCRA